MMIERIRREHGYMTRLLAILRNQLQRLQNEENVNYSLVKEIVDYLSSHSEAIHHPKEDLIYYYFMEKYGSDKNISDLANDHVELSERTHRFLEIVEMILQDAIVPQEVFLEQLSDFIVSQKQHLDLEEREIIPLVNKTFVVEDWQYLEKQWLKNEDDPVFGDTIAEQYKQLAARVRQDKQEENA
ncbi:hemerythrin domain-containing protein [Vibrio sp.]|uniref:Hemerythrin domain-containing protein n=1 Tax=Vibrio viridaestus TaxID=2487322 RepID=A0A3N9TFI5_9VIBR|nr:hemerythrin domain-containing protein [Vibrio viridaestus]MDC0609319.1 hemerythrin domain-containing protein [Vibrio sp.]RQW63001.1 hemerythrin domain-containing protein [Vibrio viridaestus]